MNARHFHHLSYSSAFLVALFLLVPAFSGNSRAVAQDKDKVSLRYKFEVGQVVRYDVTLEDDYEIQVGDNKDSPYSHQKSVKNYRVTSVLPDGSAILNLTIEAVELEIFQNGDTFTFNSKAEKAPRDQPVFLAMEDLVGKPHLQLTMSTQGEVSAFKPLVQGDQVPDNPGQAAFDVLLRLPEESLAVGESWREDFEIALPIPDSMLKKNIKMQRRYTLKKLDGAIATIELQTRVLTVLSTPEEEMALLRRRPGGTVVIDLDKGMLLSKDLHQDNQVNGFQMGPSLMSFKQRITERVRTGQTAATPEDKSTK